jgi:hypothetical protein
MTSRNVAVYGTCGLVLVACLAAANMPSQDPEPAAPRAMRPAPISPDAIAAQVQTEAARLHARMAEPPAPSAAVRNPFAFGTANAPGTRRALSAEHGAPLPGVVQAAVASDAPPAAPALLLMGIAEETTATGTHRTAIVGDAAETIYMVVEGDSLAGRYKVTKIGADAIELEDSATKGIRRLALR